MLPVEERKRTGKSENRIRKEKGRKQKRREKRRREEEKEKKEKEKRKARGNCFPAPRGAKRPALPRHVRPGRQKQALRLPFAVFSISASLGLLFSVLASKFQRTAHMPAQPVDFIGIRSTFPANTGEMQGLVRQVIDFIDNYYFIFCDDSGKIHSPPIPAVLDQSWSGSIIAGATGPFKTATRSGNEKRQ